MKNKILRSLICGLLVLSTTAVLLRADRDADRRNERIPLGHKMHPPLHRLIRTYDSSSPTGNGYTPQEMRHAYGFDQLGTTGEGQVIAIVDAYDSPTVQADLDTFCATFGLPSTTVKVYYPQGAPGDAPPLTNSALETALDVEWAHAIAPGATIDLVLARSLSTADLYAAVDYAVSLGVTQVSMSWGGPEYSTETASDFHFNVPGITFFASSGDSGAGVNYPACSPYVVGVGGTTLNLDSSGNITSEMAWSGSGGGASVYESIPSYQAGWWSSTQRGVPDVAYDADPNTGVPIYLTGFGWVQVGGTSMGAPQWAALSALANSLRSQSINSAPGVFYSFATADYAGYYRDIISGSNGNPAQSGYDLVTGLGTPLANQIVLALAGDFSPQVATPVFFPGTGAYSSAQNVTIISATSNASIRYTLDGTAPTETNGTLYSSPVLISANTTLAAIAYESGLADSPVNSGNYTFLPQVAGPTFSPADGTYRSMQAVTISSATPGASIRFTTDGSTPTETIGTLYSGPVSVNSTENLQAVAYETGFIDSPVTSGFYTIDPINVIYNFMGSADGGFPNGGLVQGSDGNFYGTTNAGGAASEGTVFKVTPTGILTTLVSFNGTNGNTPNASLVLGRDGNFYGTTLYGGSAGVGTVFKMTPAGVLATLVSFSYATGYNPWASLIQGSDGNFYGTTYGGGGNGWGTAFKMTPSGNLTTLCSFGFGGGERPEAGLVQGSDGNFYGTTHSGGLNGANGGTVFVVTPVGALTTLVSFTGNNGLLPYVAGLVQGSDGNFYGATYGGGSMYEAAGVSDGTLFKITPAGVLTTLVSFNGTNGQYPYAGLVQGSDSNLYGTTINGGSYSDGTVFRMTPAGVLTTLASFDDVNGRAPYAGLVQGSDGNFYGTTGYGGSNGEGVVFELITQYAAAPTFNPPAGAYINAPTVTIASTTPGASIRFTTDGSTPTETYGTLYSGPVSIGNATTLSAIAYAPGFFDSAVTSGIYTIVPPPSTPVFSPAGGSFTSAQSVTITSLGATTIYYTTDGSTPTTSSTLYSAPVTIANNTVLQAIGVNSGGTSSTASASFTILALAPAFSPAPGTYASAQNVTIASATSGASIRYTTDGNTPSETNGTIYSGSVNISATTTLKAIAYGAGFTDSLVTSGTYTIKTTPVVSWPVPAAITYGAALSSTQLNATANVPGSFAYTPVAGTVLGAGSQTLLVAFTPTDTTNYDNASASVSLTVNAKPVTFTISPLSFTYNGSAQGPTITPTIVGATYSTSGTASARAVGSYSVTATATGNYTGTSGSTAWTITNSSREGPFGGIPAAIPGTVQAENYDTGGQGVGYNVTTVNGTDNGYRSDGVDLEVTTDTGGGVNLGWTAAGQWFRYTVNVATAGTYTVSFRVAAMAAVTDAFHLANSSGTNLSGSVNAPTTAGWQNWVTVTASVTLPAGQQVLTLNQDKGGWNINYMTLATSSGGTVSAPTFNPPAGTYTSAQTVTITSTTSGASIAYTTDGSTPTESGGKITHGTALSNGGSVSISSTCTLKALAFKSGMIDSTVTSSLYTINVATRSLTGSSGNGWHALALTSAHTGTFTATFDATPTVSPENAVVGLSKGVATAYTGLSCIARFNPTGQIDAYNGTAFQAASGISYAKNTAYHFRMVMNVAAHTYSIYVTPAGKSELTVGLNYAFRSTAVVSSLDTWNLDVNATPANCSLTASNLNP